MSKSDWLDELFDASPIDEDVPDDIWETIYPTWTGLWTDAYDKWDEKQPSDIYPLAEILSTKAEKRIKQSIRSLIAKEVKAARIDELENIMQFGYEKFVGSDSKICIDVDNVGIRLAQLKQEMGDEN